MRNITLFLRKCSISLRKEFKVLMSVLHNSDLSTDLLYPVMAWLFPFVGFGLWHRMLGQFIMSKSHIIPLPLSVNLF